MQTKKGKQALEVELRAQPQFNSTHVREPQRASPVLAAWSSKMSQASTPGVHPNQRQLNISHSHAAEAAVRAAFFCLSAEALLLLDPSSRRFVIPGRSGQVRWAKNPSWCLEDVG